MISQSKIIISMVALFAFSASMQAVAHHSAVAFDKEQSITVSGEVTRYVWRNPHMAINMEVTDASGEKVLWKIEGPGTTVLSRQGFNRSSIDNGDNITVVLNPLRSGQPGGLLQAITLADGTVHAASEDYGEAATPAATVRRTIPSLLD